MSFEAYTPGMNFLANSEKDEKGSCGQREKIASSTRGRFTKLTKATKMPYLGMISILRISLPAHFKSVDLLLSQPGTEDKDMFSILFRSATIVAGGLYVWDPATT